MSLSKKRRQSTQPGSSARKKVKLKVHTRRSSQDAANRTPLRPSTQAPQSTPIPASARKPTTVLPRPTPEPDSPTEDELLITGITEGVRSVKRDPQSTARKRRKSAHLNLSSARKRQVRWDSQDPLLMAGQDLSEDDAPNPEEDTFAFTNVRKATTVQLPDDRDPFVDYQLNNNMLVRGESSEISEPNWQNDPPPEIQNESWDFEPLMDTQDAESDSISGDDQQTRVLDFDDITANLETSQASLPLFNTVHGPFSDIRLSSDNDIASPTNQFKTADTRPPLVDTARQGQAASFAREFEPRSTSRPLSKSAEASQPFSSEIFIAPRTLVKVAPEIEAVVQEDEFELDQVSIDEEELNRSIWPDLPSADDTYPLRYPYNSPDVKVVPLLSQPSPMPLELSKLFAPMEHAPRSRPSLTPKDLLAQLRTLRTSAQKPITYLKAAPASTSFSGPSPLASTDLQERLDRIQSFEDNPIEDSADVESFSDRESSPGLGATSSPREISKEAAEDRLLELTMSFEESQYTDGSVHIQSQTQAHNVDDFMDITQDGGQHGSPDSGDDLLHIHQGNESSKSDKMTLMTGTHDTQRSDATLEDSSPEPTFDDIQEGVDAESPLRKNVAPLLTPIEEEDGPAADRSPADITLAETEIDEHSGLLLDQSHAETVQDTENHESIFYVPQATPPRPDRFDDMAHTSPLDRSPSSPPKSPRQDLDSNPIAAPFPEPIKQSPPRQNLSSPFVENSEFLSNAVSLGPTSFESPARTFASVPVLHSTPAHFSENGEPYSPSTDLQSLTPFLGMPIRSNEELASPINFSRSTESEKVSNSGIQMRDIYQSPLVRDQSNFPMSDRVSYEVPQLSAPLVPHVPPPPVQDIDDHSPAVLDNAFSPTVPFAKPSPFRNLQASELLLTPPVVHNSFSSLADISGGSSMPGGSDDEDAPSRTRISKVTMQILSDMASSPSAHLLGDPLPPAIHSFLHNANTPSKEQRSLSGFQSSPPHPNDSEVLVRDPDATTDQEGKRRSSLNMRISTPARPTRQIEMDNEEDGHSSPEQLVQKETVDLSSSGLPKPAQDVRSSTPSDRASVSPQLPSSLRKFIESRSPNHPKQLKAIVEHFDLQLNSPVQTNLAPGTVAARTQAYELGKLDQVILPQRNVLQGSGVSKRVNDAAHSLHRAADWHAPSNQDHVVHDIRPRRARSASVAKSVTEPLVEIRSADPAIAAHVAAILKIHHDFIPEEEINGIRLDDPKSLRKSQLLHQAEVDVVSQVDEMSHRGSPSPRFRPSPRFATASPKLHLRTLSREAKHLSIPSRDNMRSHVDWSKSDWRHLESVLKDSQRYAYENDLPSPQPEEVVDRFLREVRVNESDLVGHWTRRKLLFRIDALLQRRCAPSSKAFLHPFRARSLSQGVDSRASSVAFSAYDDADRPLVRHSRIPSRTNGV